jgi:hypothetical protein
MEKDEFFPKTFRRHSARCSPSAFRPSPISGFSPWRIKYTVGFDELVGFAASVVADEKTTCTCAANINIVGSNMMLYIVQEGPDKEKDRG